MISILLTTTTVLIVCAIAQSAVAIDDYKLGPDSQLQEGVPRGQVIKSHWESKVFPETGRDYWIYVPAQYKAEKPACVMVFQDGSAYVRTNGNFRAPIVFDNLIAKKETVTSGAGANAVTDQLLFRLEP